LNFLGPVDRLQGRANLIELVEEDCGPPRDPLQERACPIQLFAAVQHGQFEIACKYNETYYRSETVQRVAGDFLYALRDLGE
jgi:hypothetical protein